jgi:hypothetical protein
MKYKNILYLIRRFDNCLLSSSGNTENLTLENSESNQKHKKFEESCNTMSAALQSV